MIVFNLKVVFLVVEEIKNYNTFEKKISNLEI